MHGFHNTAASIGVVCFFILLVACCPPAWAQETCYSGVCFPQGDISFADEVIRYIPSYSGGCVPWHKNFIDPAESLGPPDYTGGGTGFGAVSLGTGGLLEVKFRDNVLMNSGDSSHDLHVFEVGPAIEKSYIAVRPADLNTKALLASIGRIDANGDGFFEVGRIEGSTASLDLDAWAPGFIAGMLKFDAVQIIDDLLHDPACHQVAGADIDAVGAIEALAVSVEGSTWGSIKSIYR